MHTPATKSNTLRCQSAQGSTRPAERDRYGKQGSMRGGQGPTFPQLCTRRAHSLPVCCLLGRWEPALGEAATSEVEYFLLDLSPEEVFASFWLNE